MSALLFVAAGYIVIMAGFAVALYLSEPKKEEFVVVHCGGIGKIKGGGKRR